MTRPSLAPQIACAGRFMGHGPLLLSAVLWNGVARVSRPVSLMPTWTRCATVQTSRSYSREWLKKIRQTLIQTVRSVPRALP